MSQQNAYTRHHTTRTDVKPQSKKLLDDYMKYIVAAVPKIPYSVRICYMHGLHLLLIVAIFSVNFPASFQG
jgi:hypothetical protein